MLELKFDHFSLKMSNRINDISYLKMLFKIAKVVTKYVGYFGKKL